MAENRITLLTKAASVLSNSEKNNTHNILKSYYMMKVKEITKNTKLPDKYFSDLVRCSRCCLLWKDTGCSENKITPIKLSTRQRKRMKNKKKLNQGSKKLIDSSYKNILEKKCKFCNNTTTSYLQKPHRLNANVNVQTNEIKNNPNVIKDLIKSNPEKVRKNNGAKIKKWDKATLNVYKDSKDVFKINNNSNKISSTVKETPKLIKNNKKKKDKFAGLCQQAVLASAKLKKENHKDSKLNLFLKPSS